MKILFILSVISLSSYVGFSMGGQYKKRVNFYNDLIVFCSGIKNELSFFKTRLSVILEKKDVIYNENFVCLCNVALKSLKSGNYLLLSENNLEFLKFLSYNEKQTVANFFNFLGKSDVKNQKNQIDLYEKIFSDNLEKAKYDYSQKGNLYKKLGVYAGLFLAILCL